VIQFPAQGGYEARCYKETSTSQSREQSSFDPIALPYISQHIPPESTVNPFFPSVVDTF